MKRRKFISTSSIALAGLIGGRVMGRRPGNRNQKFYRMGRRVLTQMVTK